MSRNQHKKSIFPEGERRTNSKDRRSRFLTGLIEGFAKGVTGLLGFAANLEAQGKDEYAEQGEIKGRTESGKEYKGAYGFRVKVGLNPEDFRGQKKSSNKVGDKT